MKTHQREGKDDGGGIADGKELQLEIWPRAEAAAAAADLGQRAAPADLG